MKQVIHFFILSTLFSCHKEANVPQSEATHFLEIAPTEIAVLPNYCDESSGMEYQEGKFFTMNDSGGEDKVYVLDENGMLDREIQLENAKNKDWEDIALWEQTLYVGDFGNNHGNRDDLVVYQLKELDEEKVETKQIHFKFGPQTSFKKQSHSHRYDCEAMIAFEEEVILFTKDWLNQTTQVYHLPVNFEEEQVLFPAEEIEAGVLITGADYDAATKTLVLCGYMDWENYVWVFRNSTQKQFLTKDYKQIKLSGLKSAQVEGITFYDSNTVIFSTEKTNSFHQQIWKLDVGDVF